MYSQLIKIGTAHITLWWAHLTEANIALQKQITACEYEYCQQADDPSTAGQRLLSRVLTRQAIANYLNVDLLSVPIVRTCQSCGAEHGLPRIDLALWHKHLLFKPIKLPYISVTHSKMYVGVVLADVPIGIDLEYRTDIDQQLHASETQWNWVSREAQFKYQSNLQISQENPQYYKQVSNDSAYLVNLPIADNEYLGAIALPACCVNS